MTSKRILLVEDEALVAMAVEAAFSDAGYEVVSATTGSAACQLLESEHFDCVVTDIRMPGDVDGWMVATRARALQPGIPVVYTTGDSDLEAAAKGVAGGEMLIKPYLLVDAVQIVARLLGKAAGIGL